MTQAASGERARKWPALKWAIKMMEQNDFADLTLLLEYSTPGPASTTVAAWQGGASLFTSLTQDCASHTIGALKNTARYARVSRELALIQFFNFFLGPGDRDVLWGAWQEALPWFLVVGKF